MESLVEWMAPPWPWYVSGPLIGLTVPILLLLDNRVFGVSSSLLHICAAAAPGRAPLLRYDWRQKGLWNICFVAGILVGGTLAVGLFSGGQTAHLSSSTRESLAALGIDVGGLMPVSLFGWASLLTVAGFAVIVGGGFLVGFGARYAGGCTSGHAISGLANLQPASLLAVVGFFAGGLISTHLILPLLLTGRLLW